MNSKIGIFDSGIGGVTVLKELLKILPKENYIYYSDSLHNPYGEKTKDEILSYVIEIISFFTLHNCKCIVFACNTATALTIDDIRRMYPDLIIVGIEPAYKMVYDYSNNKKTLVMATPATIESERFLNLYHKYDNHNTILLACSNLAYLIENGSSSDIDIYLNNLLSDYKDIEVVVLGCTHYPLIKNRIKNILGDVLFYDGSIGVSNRVKDLLEKENLLNDNKEGSITFYDSTNSLDKKNRFYEFLNM